MSSRRGTAILLAALLAGTGFGWLLAGGLGAAVVPAAGFAVMLVLLRLDLPGPRRRRRRMRPPRPFDNRDFPAYRRIEEALMWAPVSARHFDHAVRPLLARIAATQLAERRGIDMTRDPAAARALLGDRAWPLLDPVRPASTDTGAPGVPRATVAWLTDRLENL